jgi:hypothetical protein
VNGHAATEGKSDDTQNKSYEELEQVFGEFHNCEIKILLDDCIAKQGGESTRIFKPTIGNEFV